MLNKKVKMLLMFIKHILWLTYILFKDIAGLKIKLYLLKVVQ